jgi:hypothetical protein
MPSSVYWASVGEKVFQISHIDAHSLENAREVDLVSVLEAMVVGPDRHPRSMFGLS